MIKLIDLLLEKEKPMKRDDFRDHLIKMLNGTSLKFIDFLLKQLTQQSGAGKNSHLLCLDKESSDRCSNWKDYRTQIEIAASIAAGLDDDYKYRGSKNKEKLKELVLKIAEAAASYYSKSGEGKFIDTLFQQLDKNQNGILRSLAKIEYKQEGDFNVRKKEHLIPTNLFRKELVNMVKSNNFSNFNEYADQILQINLSKEDDDKLNKAGFKTSMPSGWKWGDDPWARYKEAGIDLSTIKKI